MRGTLNISKSGVQLMVCSVMKPLKSQLALGIHNIAEGHMTKGLESASAPRFPPPDPPFWTKVCTGTGLGLGL